MQLPGELDDLYQDIILDHYKSPRNRGSVDHADLHSEGFNPFCGDQVILTAGLDDNARIARVGFDGQGCSISQASASMLTDHLRGKTIDEAEKLVRAFKGIMQGDEISEELEDELGDIVALQGVRRFPIRIKCALLGWTTLQDAIAEYRSSHAS